MGNDKASSSRSKWGTTLASVMVIAVFNILFYFVEFDAYFMTTIKEWDNLIKSFCYNVSLTLGVVLIVIRLVATLELTDETIDGECCLKDAAAYKINKMIHNANFVSNEQMSRSLLVEYEKNNVRSVGGIQWALMSIWNQQMFKEEGIWVSKVVFSMRLYSSPSLRYHLVPFPVFMHFYL